MLGRQIAAVFIDQIILNTHNLTRKPHSLKGTEKLLHLTSPLWLPDLLGLASEIMSVNEALTCFISISEAGYKKWKYFIFL